MGARPALQHGPSVHVIGSRTTIGGREDQLTVDHRRPAAYACQRLCQER